MQRFTIYLIIAILFFFQKTFSQLENSKQLIIVVSDNWQTSSSNIYLFEKINTDWKKVNKHFPVKIGQMGLAWGIGLHETKNENLKIEGDKKSPAGIFELGFAFGYDSLPPKGTKLEYVYSTNLMKCVDDVNSKFYNEIVNESKVEKDWNSAENMKFDDTDYKLGITIKHNSKNIKSNGSCIFLHCFGKNENSTVGCTAMAENKMRFLLTWLDPQKFPLVIQLPKNEYLSLQKIWRLPKI